MTRPAFSILTEFYICLVFKKIVDSIIEGSSISAGKSRSGWTDRYLASEEGGEPSVEPKCGESQTKEQQCAYGTTRSKSKIQLWDSTAENGSTPARADAHSTSSLPLTPVTRQAHIRKAPISERLFCVFTNH